MSLEPPPLASSRQKRYFQLAQASWLTVVSACGVNFALQTASGPSPAPGSRIGGAVVVGALALIGLLSGIIALFGVRRYGRKGLLWPAITGICLWLLLFALAVPVFSQTRKMALRPKSMSLRPASHSPTAHRVQDSTIGFSFDLPEGYESFAASAKPPGYSHAFVRQVPNQPNRFLLVKPLGGTSGRERLNPQMLPSGGSLSLTSFDWRGLQVDGIRVPEKSGETAFITFNVQIPLRTQAIQLGIGGPAEQESELRALVEQTLSTLEGETNW